MSGIVPIPPLCGPSKHRRGPFCGDGAFLAPLFLFLFLAFQLIAAESQSTNTSAAPRLPPPTPPPRSPVDFFRELLALTPMQQRAALANRPPENQRQILEKVREYAALSANERELRLASTELRWYFLPLMQTPPTNRPAQLQRVPENLRPLIESRITAWDEMPDDLRQELLATEAALRHLTEPGERSINPDGSRAASPELILATQRWQVMADEHRMELLNRFERFFALTSREQQAALESISAAERRQIQATLETLRALSPAQRAESVRSLLRYANLPAEERRQFLENAERWKRMTPDQRKAWRDLVARLSLGPPAIPGTQPTQPPIPPTSRPLVTNGN